MTQSARDAADGTAVIHLSQGTLRHNFPGGPQTSLETPPLKPCHDTSPRFDHPPRTLHDALLSRKIHSTSDESFGDRSSAATAVPASVGFDAAPFVGGATFSNPLFSNPLFSDSQFTLMDLDDGALARIFSKLLDPEYPNAVWSGSFPPGRAAALLAGSSAAASPGTTPAPLRHFPMDGRPNDATRDVLAASLVCHRWRRIVRNRVVKYIASFGPGSDPPEDTPTDVSAAAEEQEESEGWSSEGGSIAGASAEEIPLSVASRAHSSPVSLSGSMMGGGTTRGAAAGGRPQRCPLRCRAHVIVAVLRSDGAVPFDLRSVDRESLRCVFLLTAPEHTPVACIAAYDAKALSSCSSLTSLTLPGPPPPSIGWSLASFPVLSHFEVAAAGYSRVSSDSTRSVRSRSSAVATPPTAPIPISTVTAITHTAVPWTQLAEFSINIPQTLTSLRLLPAGTVQPAALTPVRAMTNLEALDLSTPLRWSVDNPGALPQGADVDTVQLPAPGFAPLSSLHRLRRLSLSGCSRVDATVLEAVATLTALTALDLSVCRRIDDAGIACLPALSHLEILDLAWCTSVGSTAASHIGTMRTLRALDMTGCVRLDDLGAFALASLTLLTRLQLRGCPRIGYPGLQTFGDYLAPRLMHVELTSDTDVGAGIFSMFTPRAGNCCRIAPLTHLMLRGFRALPDSAFAPLQNLSAVRALTLDCCPEAGEAAVEAIAPLVTLTRLILRFCPGVTDASLKHLAGMTCLQVLSLQGSKRLYGGGLKNISGLSGLWSVDLQQCLCLDACGLGCLAPLWRLSVLYVGKCNRIEAADFAHLPGLRALEHLSIVGLEPRDAAAVRDFGFAVIEAAGK